MLSNARGQDGGHAGDEARAEDGRGTAGDGALARRSDGHRHGPRGRSRSGGGETLAYRDLVLALGADPIRPPLDGDGAQDECCRSTTWTTTRAFAKRLSGVRSVAILGAG